MQAIARPYREAEREIQGLTASLERRALAALVRRMPRWVNLDHLTLLGLAATVVAGLAYAASRFEPAALHLVNVALLLNWFGDSLDGTLARYRHACRPRYGFYVDHIIDAFGALFVIGGLALSGYMSVPVAAALQIAYYLMAINVYLAAYTLGTFKISYGPLGGTELRILLGLLNVSVLFVPHISLLGQTVSVFDLAGAAATVALGITAGVTTVRNVGRLSRMEPLAKPV